MRRPEPWYWTKRGAWYVQVDGKQIRLHEDEAQARATWHRLMATRGTLTADERRGLSVPELVDLFLESRSSLRASSQACYRQRLTPFARAFRDRRADSLRAGEVDAYCKGGGGKRPVFQAIATFYQWARDAGFVDYNPMVATRNPWPSVARPRGMTREEFDAILAHAPGDELRALVRVLWWTGCRPGEAYTVAARHLHPVQPIATLMPEEHKTGRSGKFRFLFFPPGLMGEMRERALRRPEGPLLLNSRGTPWSKSNVNGRFAHLRATLGLDPEVVPYSTRHAFITRKIHEGVSLPLLAKMVGHSTTQLLETVYFHPDVERMIAMAADGEGWPLEVRLVTGPEGRAAGA